MRNIFLWLVMMMMCRQAYTQTVSVGQDGSRNIFSGFLLSVGGHIIGEEKRGAITDGSDFFVDQWLRGTAEFTGGGVCRNVPVKLNLLTHEIHYQDNGQEMIATNALSKLWLTDTASGQTYYFLHQSAVSDTAARHTVQWYQVLAEGKATLLLALQKSITEKTGYGASFVERTARTAKKYYLLLNARLTEVKKWKQLPGMLTGKENAADAFVDGNGLKGRAAEDYTRLIQWYNDN